MVWIDHLHIRIHHAVKIIPHPDAWIWIWIRNISILIKMGGGGTRSRCDRPKLKVKGERGVSAQYVEQRGVCYI
jgi:hypothetical protein